MHTVTIGSALLRRSESAAPAPEEKGDRRALR